MYIRPVVNFINLIFVIVYYHWVIFVILLIESDWRLLNNYEMENIKSSFWTFYFLTESNNTILTPPSLIEMLLQSQENERSFICVRGVYFALNLFQQCWNNFFFSLSQKMFWDVHARTTYVV